jgi:hypothetical protein
VVGESVLAKEECSMSIPPCDDLIPSTRCCAAVETHSISVSLLL